MALPLASGFHFQMPTPPPQYFSHPGGAPHLHPTPPYTGPTPPHASPKGWQPALSACKPLAPFIVGIDSAITSALRSPQGPSLARAPSPANSSAGYIACSSASPQAGRQPVSAFLPRGMATISPPRARRGGGLLRFPSPAPVRLTARRCPSDYLPTNPRHSLPRTVLPQPAETSQRLPFSLLPLPGRSVHATSVPLSPLAAVTGGDPTANVLFLSTHLAAALFAQPECVASVWPAFDYLRAAVHAIKPAPLHLVARVSALVAEARLVIGACFSLARGSPEPSA